MKSIKLYRQLIKKIDDYEARLLKEYSGQIRCAKGCSACCILGSIFPVEAYSIYTYITGKGELKNLKNSGSKGDNCVFLQDGACSIYPCRPVICRTHGYPILTGGRVDYCPENFRGIERIDSGFILDLDALNRALVSINLLFQQENKETFFSAERIMLADLKEKSIISIESGIKSNNQD